MQIVQHYPLKGFEEIFLEVEASEFFLDQELVGKLTERIDSEDCHHQICVGTNPDEMLAEHLPDFSPHESDSSHVQICNLNNRL